MMNSESHRETRQSRECFFETYAISPGVTFLQMEPRLKPRPTRRQQMKSSSLTTNTLGKWAVLCAALLTVSQCALASNQLQLPTKTLPTLPAKSAPAKASPAPAKPQVKPPAQQPAKPKPPVTQHPTPPEQRPHRGLGATGRSKDNGGDAGTSNRGSGSGRDTANGSKTRRTPNAGAFTRPKDTTAKPGPNGGKTYTARNGAVYNVDRNNKLTSLKTSSGREAKFASSGKLASIHTKDGMTINHAGNGARNVETTRRDGTRVVSGGPNSGFTERTIMRGGRTETVRTTVVDGKTSTYVYERGFYRGVYFNTYVPVYFFAPSFYGWVYDPWASPVHWVWGWDSQPWYSDCGYYFAASPFYAGPTFWLTDYMLAQDLQAAHDSAEQNQDDSGTDGVASDTVSAREPNTEENDDSDTQMESGPVTGLAFTPLFIEGTQSFAPGFSAVGSLSRNSDFVGLNATASVTYTFTVSAGRTLTVAYGIPAGGYLNSVPAEISLNRVVIASVDKDPDYGWGKITPKQRLLWHRTFPAGHYVLTIRSGGTAVNFYGLWIGNSSVGKPAHVSVEVPDQASASGNDENQDAPALSPAVKKELADQVNEQINAEKAAAAAGSTSARDQLPAALDPNQRVFIVSRALAEQAADGTQCSLSPGDVLTRTGNIPDANQNVTAMVTSSQKNDCASGSNLAVSIQDFQDMHNDFLQKMDAGLQHLAANKGKKGMPNGPEAGAHANPVGQADSDPDAVTAVQQQEQAADASEQDVTNTMNSGQ